MAITKLRRSKRYAAPTPQMLMMIPPTAGPASAAEFMRREFSALAAES